MGTPPDPGWGNALDFIHYNLGNLVRLDKKKNKYKKGPN